MPKVNPTPHHSHQDQQGQEELRERIWQEIVNPSVVSEVSTADIAVGMLSTMAVGDRVEGILRYFLAWHQQHQQPEPEQETRIPPLKVIEIIDSWIHKQTRFHLPDMDGYREMLDAVAKSIEQPKPKLYTQAEVEAKVAEARLDTAKHLQEWFMSDADHHDLQRIIERMVEGRYNYEIDE